jgi:hypothetical protein
MNETPQDKLYAAAQRLDALAECVEAAGPSFDWDTFTFLVPDHHDDALEAAIPWCKAIPPKAAEHLSTWLRERGDDYYSEAKAQSKWPPGGYTMLLPSDFEAAVAFADLVLGGSA